MGFRIANKKSFCNGATPGQPGSQENFLEKGRLVLSLTTPCRTNLGCLSSKPLYLNLDIMSQPKRDITLLGKFFFDIKLITSDARKNISQKGDD